MVKPRVFSRFSVTEPIVNNGKETFGLWREPEFMNRDNLNRNQVISFKTEPSEAGRPDKIANRLYGSPLLEWILVMFNKPENPLGWPSVGQEIEAPIRSIVLANT